MPHICKNPWSQLQSTHHTACGDRWHQQSASSAGRNAKLKNIAKHFNYSVLAKQNLKKNSKRTWPPPAQYHSAWTHSLELHAPHDAGAETSTQYLFWRIWKNCYSSCRSMGNSSNTLEPVEKVTLEISRSEPSIYNVIPSITVLKMELQAEGHTRGGLKH